MKLPAFLTLTFEDVNRMSAVPKGQNGSSLAESKSPNGNALSAQICILVSFQGSSARSVKTEHVLTLPKVDRTVCELYGKKLMEGDSNSTAYVTTGKLADEDSQYHGI